MSDYTWSNSKPYCLGLGKVFGNENSYWNSDMQFAKETAEYLFEAIKLTEKYKEEREIVTAKTQSGIVSNTHDFVLELNYRFEADRPYRITSSEVSLQLSSATEPVRHGAQYSALDFSEPGPETVKSETFGNRSYAIESVYFDTYGSLAGIRWRDYSNDVSNSSLTPNFPNNGSNLDKSKTTPNLGAKTLK